MKIKPHHGGWLATQEAPNGQSVAIYAMTPGKAADACYRLTERLAAINTEIQGTLTLPPGYNAILEALEEQEGQFYGLTSFEVTEVANRDWKRNAKLHINKRSPLQTTG